MTAGRVAALAGAAGLGVGVAGLGLLAHRHVVRVGDVPLPWGLALALVTAFAIVVAVGLAGAPAAAIVAGGWTVCVLLVLRGRPEGDFLLAADATGQAFAWGGLATVAAGFVVSVRTSARPSR